MIMEDLMSKNGKGLTGFYEKLPPSLIKKNNVTLIPEGAIGYLVGPTLALLANSILATPGQRAFSPGCR